MIMSSAYRNVRETVTDDPLNEGSTAVRIRTLGFINEKNTNIEVPKTRSTKFSQSLGALDIKLVVPCIIIELQRLKC